MTTAEIVQLQTTAIENAKFRLNYLREQLASLEAFVRGNDIIEQPDHVYDVPQSHVRTRLMTSANRRLSMRTWTAAQRRTQSHKMKAAWRARKAAAK